ncbi:MAG TPA: hypothetical protein VM146_08925 [Steroidobacteraceae bacterium]|nr:hypothetical protein [Steroidobacteraceae bacterium]
MDCSPFIKKLNIPDGFTAPRKLVHPAVVAHALTRADLVEDVRGINDSLALINQTRGGGWPTEPVTDDFNFVDLVWHELEFREATSFAYVLRDTGGAYMGCAYLYPMGRRTPLTAALLDYDVDVSWWVIPAAYDRGLYATVYDALRGWLTTHFSFWRPYYSNREIPRGE